MRISRWSSAVAAIAALLIGVRAAPLAAQGTTTGAVTGTVTDEAGRPLEDVQIEVVNGQTGFRTGSLTRGGGRYYVQNLEVGPGYRVTARRIGYAPVTNENIRIILGQATRWDVRLQQQATELNTVR